MAKYRHRIFEMYEFRAEAIRALLPTSGEQLPGNDHPTPSTFRNFTISHPEGVTHIQFKKTPVAAEESQDAAEEKPVVAEDKLSGLREDFTQLTGQLKRNCKVLLDFLSVESFETGAIDEIVRFKKDLQTKGSRIVLCSLNPDVRASFFVTPSI